MPRDVVVLSCRQNDENNHVKKPIPLAVHPTLEKTLAALPGCCEVVRLRHNGEVYARLPSERRLWLKAVWTG